MQLIGVVVFVGHQVALDRRRRQHPLRHDAFIFIHGGQTPSGDGPVRSQQSMDFIAFGFATGGTTIASLTVLEQPPMGKGLPSIIQKMPDSRKVRTSCEMLLSRACTDWLRSRRDMVEGEGSALRREGKGQCLR